MRSSIRHVRQPLHGVPQIVGRKVRVSARDRRALMSDDLSREHVRETARLEQRHRAVSQTVERNLGDGARFAVTLARAHVSPRLDQTGVNENRVEAVAQHAGALRARGVRKDVRVRVVARWQRSQVITERLHERQDDSPSGLARCERDLAVVEVNGAPCEPSQIAETLSEIKSEEHETSPLRVTRFEDALDLRDREAAPLRFLARLESLHERSRIYGEQSLPHGFAEADARNFHAEVRGRARAFLRLVIAEPQYVVRSQRGEVAVRFRSEEI
jgi:hypothetical protein